jgi:rod shape determining protein RodA
MFKDFKSLLNINWIYFFLLLIIFWIGEINLYSAAGGNLEPWAISQLKRFVVFLPIVFLILLLQPKFIFNITELVLIAVMFGLLITLFFGYTGMGAKRWIRVGGFNLQVSEFAKIALVIFMAKYFHKLNAEKTIGLIKSIIPLLISLVLFLLVAIQPDLGTALIILILGLVAIFYAGIKLIYPLLSMILIALVSPFLWTLLKPYQQNRIMIFLNPDLDPLGKGYHIIQSKIAIGSGGLTGKGFMSGTQSQLNFLPEKHNDFMLAVLLEETGLIGGFFIFSIFFYLILISMHTSIVARSRFSSIACASIAVLLFLYIFINCAMITGLIPIVGVPIPMLSYGGSAVISLCAAMGFVLNARRQRDIKLEGIINA